MKKSMFKTKISQAEAEEQPQTESKDDSVYCHFPVLCLCCVCVWMQYEKLVWNNDCFVFKSKDVSQYLIKVW